MTTEELIEKINSKLIPFSTGIIVADMEDNEYIIEDVEVAMGGCEHPVLRLKKIEDPHDKWFRTRDIYIEKLNKDIELYESENFQNRWAELHDGDVSELRNIIDRQKSLIESIKERYEPNEIID